MSRMRSLAVCLALLASSCAASSPSPSASAVPRATSPPIPADWAQLRARVAGRLIDVHLVLEPCVADAKGAACAAVLREINKTRVQ